MKTKRAITIELNSLTKEQELIIGHLTYHTGRLWNQANYLIKNKLAKVNIFDLYNKLKDNSIHLRSLHSRSAQIVLDELVRAWNNFFKFLKNQEKYKKQGIDVFPPSYINPKLPHRVVIWDKSGFKVFGSKIRLSLSKGLVKHLSEKYNYSKKYLWIDTGYKDLENLDILNIQIVPSKQYGQLSYKLVIIYEKEISCDKPKSDKAMAIDYGVSNFATCVVENNPVAYIIDGRGLKSLLRKRLKRIYRLQSKRDNLKAKKLPTNCVDRRLHKEQKKINNLLRDYAHKVSNIIKDIAVKNDVAIVIVGDVQKSKNKENNLPDVVNQMFSLLPHGKVTNYLTYKLEEAGIEVKLVNESYTSVADSCINAGIKTNSNGRRIKRGLFLSPVKGYINADVNGARNILRKFKKNWFDLITGLKKIVKIRIYKLSKGISNSLLYTGIGVAGGVNPPWEIRTGLTSQTLPEAPSVRVG